MVDERKVELFIGPNHPGAAGNSCMHLWLEGDIIKKIEPEYGFLHRAFEKLMEHRNLMQNVSIVPRICVPEPDINEDVYCRCIEDICDIEVPPRAKYIRTIVLELARITATFLNLGFMCGGLGIYTVMQWAFADRDFVLDLFEWLTGARVYHIFMIPGGVRRDFPEGFEKKIEQVLDYIERRLIDYDRTFYYNSFFVFRTKGRLVIGEREVKKYCLSGPAARAAGYPIDMRKIHQYEAYPEVDFDIVTLEDGDAYSRMLVKRMEIEQSIDIIRQLLAKLPAGEVLNKPINYKKWIPPRGESYQVVESTNGEYGYYMRFDGESPNPYRVHVRGPSYTTGTAMMQDVLIDKPIEDMPVYLSSFGVCPPEIDR